MVCKVELGPENDDRALFASITHLQFGQTGPIARQIAAYEKLKPTNNVSERALRPSVIFRKVTNGFRSDWGAKVYADLLHRLMEHDG